MPTRVCLALIIPAALAALACQKPVEPVPVAKIEKDYNRPLPPGGFALEKVDPEDYPDFGDAWYRAKRLGLRKSVAHSLAYLKTPTSKQFYPLGPITHERVVASLEKFLDILDQSDTPEKLNDLVARNFDIYRSVGCDDDGTVLFTGYYSPIFEGSRERTDRFKFPRRISTAKSSAAHGKNAKTSKATRGSSGQNSFGSKIASKPTCYPYKAPASFACPTASCMKSVTPATTDTTIRRLATCSSPMVTSISTSSRWRR